jgi:predicted metalloprotease with PDZ domain
MEKNKNQKSFDAVKMMLEIRDNISAETQGMTFEELKAYIKKELSNSKTKLIGRR